LLFNDGFFFCDLEGFWEAIDVAQVHLNRKKYDIEWSTKELHFRFPK